MAGGRPVPYDRWAMPQESPEADLLPLVLRLRPAIKLSDRQLAELSDLNDLRLELSAKGDLEIMPPTYGWTGNKESRVNARLDAWAERDGTGVVFSPNAGFRLPNGAIRSPDASWVRRSRIAELPEQHRRKFLPLCPDFVGELRSSSDRLSVIQAKMQEYMDNGARLGWLIDPLEQQVYVYRAGASPERLDEPLSLSGDPLLPGFVLDLRGIWEPGF